MWIPNWARARQFHSFSRCPRPVCHRQRPVSPRRGSLPAWLPRPFFFGGGRSGCQLFPRDHSPEPGLPKFYALHNYDQAMELFRQASGIKIDLVFSDVGLPRVNAALLCARNSKAVKPGLPVVSWPAAIRAGNSTKRAWTSFTTEAFLSKPFNTDEILQSCQKKLWTVRG